MHWPAQSPIFDISIHMGTLGAVIFYFRDDVVKLLRNIPNFLKGQWKNPSSQMSWFLILGTLPSVVFGLLISHWGLKNLYHLGIIGSTCIIYGLLLYYVDKISLSHRTISSMTFKDSLKIGFAQALALVPGTSRSGISITMARYLEFTRLEAAKFSFLLSLPAIIAAATLTIFKAWKEGEIIIIEDLSLGFILSFVVGILTIKFMMNWLQTSRFTPFAIYRVLLGLVLLALWAKGWEQI